MAGPKLSGCLPVRSSWTQVIRIFTSQKWQDPSYQTAYQLEVAGPKLSGFSPVKHGGPKLSGFSPVKSGRTKLSSCLPVRSSWTQVIRIFTSQKWQDPSYQAAYQLEVAGPKLSGFSTVKHRGPKLSDSSPVTSGSGSKISGFSPVKSGWTQVIRLLTS